MIPNPGSLVLLDGVPHLVQEATVDLRLQRIERVEPSHIEQDETTADYLARCSHRPAFSYITCRLGQDDNIDRIVHLVPQRDAVR